MLSQAKKNYNQVFVFPMYLYVCLISIPDSSLRKIGETV